MSIVEGLKKIYDGGFTLDIPRWEIADCGVTALWGPSGSGKTSVFRVLMGLEDCATLSWKFGDLDLARVSAPERKLGVVFQSLELFPHMTAAENILFAARCRGVVSEEAQNKLEELSADLQMKSYLQRPARVLSGGEAQRVALARALIGKPRMLLLDEPFSSLDASLRGDARVLVKKTIAKFSIPTLLVTHDEEDLRVLADHVVKIVDGKLIL